MRYVEYFLEYFYVRMENEGLFIFPTESVYAVNDRKIFCRL